MSLRNVTLDTSVNSTQISYAPASCTGAGWALNTTKGPDLAYRSCTIQGKDSLSVNLTFTGVAIYYQSPFFDGLSLRFILDGSTSNDINISSPRTPTTSSTPAVATIWQQLGLQNTTHVLEITPGAGVKTLKIGSFIITQSSPVNATTTTPKAAAQAGPTQSETTTRVGIGFGAAFGALAFLIFLWISWTLARRKVEKKKYYDDWPQDHRIIPDDRHIEFDRTAFSHNSHSQVSPHSPPLQDSGVALRSIQEKYSASQDSLSAHGRYQAPTASDHGVASPVPSNSLLLAQRAESSQSHTEFGGAAPTYTAHPTRLEPVRASPHSSLAPSPSSYTSANRYTNPHAYSPQNRPIPLLSRTPAAVSVTRSMSVPAPAAVALQPTGVPSMMTRGSTLSGKLEPVRKQRT
ncbi:hypothetical protein D9619_004294 [Psilocybe cf. subviscida]|uniref:Uncharacterized protein n=1 Tax=Psilocybe cf. subviscida TaxID=2480587 RepID=A0A8H5F7U9_9AGAR|nr:hypothetical protein D9619_004294 [Psilocybe cf. subviscida]